jgi:uncharacterized membrane protein (DUF485 family)
VDRETAARNVRTGLLFASLAVGVLALTFVIAILYIRG